jgi:hypothetical protein
LKTRALIWTIAVCFFAALLAAMPCMAQEAQPPAGEVTADLWPRIIDEGGVRYTIFQPQLDSWDGYNYAAHAAVSVLPAEGEAGAAADSVAGDKWKLPAHSISEILSTNRFKEARK